MLIDGTGGAPRGPMDIVIENNRIKEVRGAGSLRGGRVSADHEIDAAGQYVMPGFVDLHVHAGSRPKNADAEYAYKLWLAHGVTTVRGVPLSDNAFSVREKERSAKNEIVAPRIFNYQRPGTGWGKGFPETPEAAREWVRWAAANGVDGLKLGSHRPEIMGALLDEAKKLGSARPRTSARRAWRR
jgi:cytosine/adenosine deaminase-related metal-dependent hydrolase